VGTLAAMTSESRGRSDENPNRELTYAGAGVDIDAGDAMVGRIQSHMRRTYGPRVLGRHGAFAGLFRLDYNEKLFARNYREPVLVACADGVGSKVKLAIELGVCDTVGQDLVAMNVNDLIVQGAEPLLFLDYIGTHKLDPARMTQIVKGVADACAASGCALLGGETAELPELYAPQDFDLAGFAVGVCELRRLIDGRRARAGDVLLGLSSCGLHSNGYTLVRAVLREAKLDLDRVYPELDPVRPLGQVLLTPTRLYARSVVSVLRGYKVKRPVTAMSHITGGGLPGNLPRMLPEKLNARVRLDAWPVPPVFRFLQKHGGVDDAEMLRVFNMGLGFVMAVRPHFADSIARQLQRMGESVRPIGRLERGKGELVLEGEPVQ